MTRQNIFSYNIIHMYNVYRILCTLMVSKLIPLIKIIIGYRGSRLSCYRMPATFIPPPSPGSAPAIHTTQRPRVYDEIHFLHPRALKYINTTNILNTVDGVHHATDDKLQHQVVYRRKNSQYKIRTTDTVRRLRRLAEN